MKSEKRQIAEGIELPDKKKSECSEKRKPTNTWEYWKRNHQTSGNEKKIFKRIPQENEKTTQNQTI